MASSARRGGRLSTTLALSLVLEIACPGAVGVARAEGPTSAPAAAATSAPAPGTQTGTQTVEQLASQAYQQTAAGKYADAIASYMKAYEISKAGAILYNIATICDRKLHERTLAMEYFRRYLQAPDAEPDFARKATERLSVLKAEAAADEKAKASAPLPTPPLSSAPPVSTAHDESSPSADADRGGRHGSGLLVAGIVVGAVGVLAVGGGLGVGAAAKSKYDSAPGCDATSCSSTQGTNADQQAIMLATISTVSVIAGAVFIAAGIPLVIVGAQRGKTQVGSIAIAPEVTRSGGGLGLQGTF